ncbi:MAG: DUF2085 domain-containing protein [Ignavibacteriales bacterium]|nr:MAG: DUF2085 domain-containing protein [Ignavibacteriales bacterium]
MSSAKYNAGQKFSKNLLFNLTFSVACLLWLTGIVSPVLITNSQLSNYIIPVINYPYSLVCHQNADKTLHIHNASLLVCSRCTGIYMGAFISSIFLLMISRFTFNKKYFLWIAPLPVLLDIIFINSGLYTYNKPVAFGTGMFSGSILFIYISNEIKNFLINR